MAAAVSIRTTKDLALQRMLDSRRSRHASALNARMRAVVEARLVAATTGERYPYRQALIDLASYSLTLADALEPPTACLPDARGRS